MHRVGAQSLTSDETPSVGDASGGVGDVWQVVSGGDPNMGLYYVLPASLAAAGYVRVPLPVSFRRVDVTLYRH